MAKARAESAKTISNPGIMTISCLGAGVGVGVTVEVGIGAWVGVICGVVFGVGWRYPLAKA